MSEAARLYRRGVELLGWYCVRCKMLWEVVWEARFSMIRQSGAVIRLQSRRRLYVFLHSTRRGGGNAFITLVSDKV